MTPSSRGQLAASLVELEASYKISRTVRVALDIFNLLNAQDSDIDYYYASRLPGEPPDGVNDIHFHPVEPREYRVGLTVAF